MPSDLILYCLIMFLATVAGGLITLIRQWSDEWLHLFLSFGAGIFLGAVFFHLLPEVMRLEHSYRAGMFILGGYLLIFFVERILLSREGGAHSHGHVVVSLTVLIGLSVHSLVEGFGLAVTMVDPQLAWILLVSILAHKIPAAFSLVSLALLAKQSRQRSFYYLLLFAATAPAGALVLGPLLGLDRAGDMWQTTGLVTGSFLYVATADLLPEVFHSHRRRWVNLFLMLVGITLMSLVGTESGHH
jgi:zinc and cadmium transporter